MAGPSLCQLPRIPRDPGMVADPQLDSQELGKTVVRAQALARRRERDRTFRSVSRDAVPELRLCLGSRSWNTDATSKHWTATT
jgi:hypothetical protein